MPEVLHPDWPEAIATVTACHYDAGAGRAMAFGLPSSPHFQITCNYWAAGELHTTRFDSEKAIPQNTLFSIRYNPEAPHQNTHTSAAVPRSPILAIGLIGSVVLSLTWLVLLRGCHS